MNTNVCHAGKCQKRSHEVWPQASGLSGKGWPVSSLYQPLCFEMENEKRILSGKTVMEILLYSALPALKLCVLKSSISWILKFKLSMLKYYPVIIRPK